jgi:hypothetical protein
VRAHYSEEETISVEVLIEEQRRLARSKNPFERVIGTLFVAAILKERLIRLPNSTISRLLTDYVWSNLNLLGPESVLVETASERLRHPFPVLVKSAKENLN